MVRKRLRVHPVLLLAARTLQPLLVRQGRARRHLTHPGTVRRLREVHRNVKLARQGRQAADMVGVLMRDQDGVQFVGLFACGSHASHQFAA